MHLEAANLYLIQASTGWKPLASNSSSLVFVKLLAASVQFLGDIYPQHKATFTAVIKLQPCSQSQQRGEGRMRWRHSPFLPLEESPEVKGRHVDEQEWRRCHCWLMCTEERPWARGVHGEKWERIGQKALDGAGKSK